MSPMLTDSADAEQKVQNHDLRNRTIYLYAAAVSALG